MATVKNYINPKIDGISIACPSANGVQITRELIQSEKTRRTSGKGTMTGKVVATKVTVKFSFPPSLKPDEVKKIKQLVINKTFKHSLTFVNEYSEEETIKVYFGEYSVEQYGFLNGKIIPQSFGFTAVEI